MSSSNPSESSSNPSVSSSSPSVSSSSPTVSSSNPSPTNAAIIAAGESAGRVFAADICPSGAYQFLLVRNDADKVGGSCTIDVMKMVDDNV